MGSYRQTGCQMFVPAQHPPAPLHHSTLVSFWWCLPQLLAPEFPGASAQVPERSSKPMKPMSWNSVTSGKKKHNLMEVGSLVGMVGYHHLYWPGKWEVLSADPWGRDPNRGGQSWEIRGSLVAAAAPSKGLFVIQASPPPSCTTG